MAGRLHIPVALLEEKQPPVSIGHEAVWAPESVSMLQREKNLLPLPGMQQGLIYCQARSLFAILTALSRLSTDLLCNDYRRVKRMDRSAPHRYPHAIELQNAHSFTSSVDIGSPPHRNNFTLA
jgi:hypothetical protein